MNKTSDTPIHDQLVLEQAQQDPEGLALVAAIHERKQAGARPAERRTLAGWFGWSR